VFLRYLLLTTGIWPPRHLLCVILTKSLPSLLLKSCQFCVMPPVHSIATLKVLRGVKVSKARSLLNLAVILAFLAFLTLLGGTLSQSCL
jgi:hypothetical protein